MFGADIMACTSLLIIKYLVADIKKLNKH